MSDIHRSAQHGDPIGALARVVIAIACDGSCGSVNLGRIHARRGLRPSDDIQMVGWPGASQPPAPTDPYVTVSRHTALVALIIWWPVSPRPSARSTSAGMQPLVS